MFNSEELVLKYFVIALFKFPLEREARSVASDEERWKDFSRKPDISDEDIFGIEMFCNLE